MFRLNLQLAQKLTFVFVLFAAALLAFVGVLTYSSGRSSLEAATDSVLLSSLTEKAAAFGLWVNFRQVNVTALASLPDVIAYSTALTQAVPGSQAAQSAHDNLLLELRPSAGTELSITDLTILDSRTGNVLASTDPAKEGMSQASEQYFINGKKELFLQNPRITDAQKHSEMIMAVPVRDSDGHVIAVLAAYLNLDQLQFIVARRTGMQQTDDAYLINQDHQFLTQPRLLSQPAVLQREMHTDTVNTCLAGKSGIGPDLDYQGHPAISAYQWLDAYQSCLIVSIDQSEAFQPVQAFGVALVVIGGLALIMASLLSLVLSRSLTRSLRTLQSNVARFGHGELDVRLPENTHDELGNLAHEFNTMAATLSQKERETRDYAAQLEQKVQERTEALQTSDTELRTLFSAIDDVILVLDRDGRCLKVAPTRPTQSYLKPSILLGKTAYDVFHLEQADTITSRICQVLDSGQAVEFEQAMRFNDGTTTWLAATISRLDENSALWVSRDITEHKRAEETRSMLAAIVESSDDAIIGKSVDGKIQTWNKGAERLYGYTAEEAIGKSVALLIPPEREDDFPKIVSAIKQGESIEHYKTVRQRKDGKRLEISLTVSPIRDGQGNVVGASAIARDITGQNRAEQERMLLLLREQEARTQAEERDLLRTLIDHLPDYIFIKDVEGRFVLSNTAHAQAGQRASANELIGRTAFDFFPSDLAVQYEADDRDVMESGESVLNVERTTVGADGKRRVVLTSKIPWRNAQGKVIGIIGTSHDFTDRKQMEEALSRSEALEREHRVLAEALHDIAKTITGTLDPELVMNYILDNVGGVVKHDTANILMIHGDVAKAAYWRGYPAELEEFISSYQFPVKQLDNLWQMFTMGVPCLISDTAADPNWQKLPETPVVASYIGAPIKIRGGVVGFLNLNSKTRGFFQLEQVNRLQSFADLASIAIQNSQLYEGLNLYANDLEKRVEERTIELRRALEKEKELGALKSNFITIASHEFRTPLTIISSSISLMEMAIDKMTAEQRGRNFDKIAKAVTQMVSLLDQALTFDSADTGLMGFHPEAVNLEELCQALIQEMQATASPAHRLTCSFAGDLGNILVDWDLLHKIIDNLLSNAIKFSPAGGPVLLDLTYKDDRLVIRVEDHGIGIPQADRSHIFEPFNRAGNVGTLHGTGLGLSITRKAVALHGGTIDFESRTIDTAAGSGTTFCVTIPIRTMAASNGQPQILA